jgi:hypothetical protein
VGSRLVFRGAPQLAPPGSEAVDEARGWQVGGIILEHMFYCQG